MLPVTDNRTMVVRTDFSAPQVWERVRTTIDHPPGGELASSYFSHVDDVEYAGHTSQQILALLSEDYKSPIVVLADALTMSSSQMPLLVVDLVENSGASFRSIPGVLWNVDNNLFVDNLSFGDYTESAARDGGVHTGGGRAGQIKLFTAMAQLKGIRFDPATLDDPGQDPTEA